MIKALQTECLEYDLASGFVDSFMSDSLLANTDRTLWGNADHLVELKRRFSDDLF